VTKTPRDSVGIDARLASLRAYSRLVWRLDVSMVFRDGDGKSLAANMIRWLLTSTRVHSINQQDINSQLEKIRKSIKNIEYY
jgi:hypothetical protein